MQEKRKLYDKIFDLLGWPIMVVAVLFFPIAWMIALPHKVFSRKLCKEEKDGEKEQG